MRSFFLFASLSTHNKEFFQISKIKKKGERKKKEKEEKVLKNNKKASKKKQTKGQFTKI